MGNASWDATIENIKKTVPNNGIVAIASSTGGPAALMRILPLLPKDFPYPVVVVQHIWPGFATGLAETMKEKCILPVRSAEDGEIVKAGNIYVSPSEYHIRVKKAPAHHHVFAFEEADSKKGSPRPSANRLFESLLDSNYDSVICVVLTGMGTDGTEGILKLSEKKEISVLVQDEESCVVYGMPGSILEKYKECEIVEIDRMADVICEKVK